MILPTYHLYNKFYEQIERHISNVSTNFNQTFLLQKNRLHSECKKNYCDKY